MKIKMIIWKKCIVKHKLAQYQKMIEQRPKKFNLSRSNIRELGQPT
jgi:hypothetical protein